MGTGAWGNSGDWWQDSGESQGGFPGGLLGGVQGLQGFLALLNQGESSSSPQERFGENTFVDPNTGDVWMVIPQYNAVGEQVGEEFQLVRRADQGGGGGAGRTQFPSEAGLQYAQADQIRAMMELLMPQFELEQDRFGLQEQQFAHQQAEDEFNRGIQEALVALQEGRLTLDQFRLQVEAGLQQRGMDIEEMLGMRGLDIRETLGMGGLASEEANRALTRELGFANLEEQQKDRALDSAMGAISSYLQGMSLADNRRVAAFQETRALIPFRVDPEQQYFSGMGPESSLARAVGPGYQPEEIYHMEVPDPAQLATSPTQEQIGGGLMDLLGGLPQ